MASRILVVGDPAVPTAASASTLAIKLALDGYQVRSAASAADASALAAWWCPDAILMALPDDAWAPPEWMQEAAGLRRAHPDVPLVAIYREQHAIDEDALIEVGFTLTYPVPVDFRELRLGLEWLIRGGDQRPSHPALPGRSMQVGFSARG